MIRGPERDYVVLGRLLVLKISLFYSCTFNRFCQMFKDLQLIWISANKPNDEVSGKFLDYMVSGQLLREYLGMPNSSQVTPFGWFQNVDAQKKSLKQLRLQSKSELVDHRVELYICGACGDIGCGSVTVKVIDGSDKIIWSAFAIQSSPDEISEVIDVEDVEFDRNNYFNALSHIK